MNDDLFDMRDRLGTIFESKARKTTKTAFWVKLLLIIVGTFVSNAAAFFSQDQLLPITIVQVIGLAGLCIALVGGVFVVITEDDGMEALEEARQALDEAARQSLKSREIFEELLQYENAVDRLSALYSAISLARGTVEQALLREEINEEQLIKACLTAANRELKVALGFTFDQVWTIGIYKTVQTAEGFELSLVAHDRSVQCEIENARRWPDGVGVGGIALAKNDEVVVPDLDDPALGTAFRLGDMMKPEDRERYKSLFAVPVEVGRGSRPWGVVLATSDVPNYFGSDDNVGVDPEEAVRALSGIVALSVAASLRKTTMITDPKQDLEG